MNNYSCNLQIVSFSAVKNGFISPAGVGNRALGGEPSAQPRLDRGEQLPQQPQPARVDSPRIPVYSTNTSGKSSNHATGTMETLCWLLEPFWFRDEASNYENTPKTRKKRLIRQSQVCTGGLSMEKLPFILPPPQLLTALPTPRGEAETEGCSTQRGEKHRATQTHLS